ncbi:MAG: DMT family protein, partial [Bdellovibrionales bacterium]
ITLLVISNIFMTFAWYGHLKNHKESPLWIVILLSWGIAFFEYCFQVPANRLGSEKMSLAQLKITQEVITMLVSSFFLAGSLTQKFSVEISLALPG